MKQYYPFAILVLLLILSPGISFSQSGFLDASFGNGGKVVTPVGDSSSVANAVAITPEGKIIVGGYSFVAGQSVATLLQYNSDGTMDTAFGDKGKVIVSLSQSAINSIAMLSNGEIIAGGYIGVGNSVANTQSFLIARYNKQGYLDSTFGNNGSVVTPYNFFGSPGDLILQKLIIKPDGKIIAGGGLGTFTFESFPVLAQYMPDGSLDSTFGINGTTTKGIYFLGGKMDAVNDLAVTTDGKLIAVIDEYPMGVLDHTDFAIYRLLPNGDNDSTFGDNGVIQTDIDSISGDDAYSAVVLPDNSFVVAGYSYKYIYHPNTNTIYSATSIALVKYYANGFLDSSFGINGKMHTLALPDSTVYSNQIVLSPDGSLFVSGYTSSGRQNFIIAKYHPNGTLDSSFGSNGITTTDFSSNNDISYLSALQPDGKIILAGSTGSNTSFSVALARYNNDIIYPLRLLSFTAVQNGVVNILQWQTAQEVNVGTYEVQRSANGKDYNVMGYVNAGSNTYHFTDYKPISGSNYYRLKIIDRNGAFTYSAVMLINNNQSFIINMYPNPVKGNLQVQVDNSKAMILQWQIVSAEGKVLRTDQWQVQAGNNMKNVNVAALSKGNYYLIVTEKNNQQKVVKFEKL